MRHDEDWGYGVLDWDGNNIAGHAAPSGTYILRLEGGSESAVQTMVLVR